MQRSRSKREMEGCIKHGDGCKHTGRNMKEIVIVRERYKHVQQEIEGADIKPLSELLWPFSNSFQDV